MCFRGVLKIKRSQGDNFFSSPFSLLSFRNKTQSGIHGIAFVVDRLTHSISVFVICMPVLAETREDATSQEN